MKNNSHDEFIKKLLKLSPENRALVYAEIERLAVEQRAAQ